MTENDKKQLLKDKRVVEEISRHQWIESEKIGYDVGFDQAASEWLEKFSKAWMRYHMPKRKSASTKGNKAAFTKKVHRSPR